jgi:hypothetical protein
MALVDASAQLKATFHVGQDSANLKGVFITGSGIHAVAQGIEVDYYVTKSIVT